MFNDLFITLSESLKQQFPELAVDDGSWLKKHPQPPEGKLPPLTVPEHYFQGPIPPEGKGVDRDYGKRVVYVVWNIASRLLIESTTPMFFGLDPEPSTAHLIYKAAQYGTDIARLWQLASFIRDPKYVPHIVDKDSFNLCQILEQFITGFLAEFEPQESADATQFLKMLVHAKPYHDLQDARTRFVHKIKKMRKILGERIKAYQEHEQSLRHCAESLPHISEARTDLSGKPQASIVEAKINAHLAWRDMLVTRASTQNGIVRELQEQLESKAWPLSLNDNADLAFYWNRYATWSEYATSARKTLDGVSEQLTKIKFDLSNEAKQHPCALGYYLAEPGGQQYKYIPITELVNQALAVLEKNQEQCSSALALFQKKSDLYYEAFKWLAWLKPKLIEAKEAVLSLPHFKLRCDSLGVPEVLLRGSQEVAISDLSSAELENLIAALKCQHEWLSRKQTELMLELDDDTHCRDVYICEAFRKSLRQKFLIWCEKTAASLSAMGALCAQQLRHQKAQQDSSSAKEMLLEYTRLLTQKSAVGQQLSVLREQQQQQQKQSEAEANDLIAAIERMVQECVQQQSKIEILRKAQTILRLHESKSHYLPSVGLDELSAALDDPAHKAELAEHVKKSKLHPVKIAAKNALKKARGSKNNHCTAVLRIVDKALSQMQTGGLAEARQSLESVKSRANAKQEEYRRQETALLLRLDGIETALSGVSACIVSYAEVISRVETAVGVEPPKAPQTSSSTPAEMTKTSQLKGLAFVAPTSVRNAVTPRAEKTTTKENGSENCKSLIVFLVSLVFAPVAVFAYAAKWVIEAYKQAKNFDSQYLHNR